MPELPEVEQVRRTLEATIAGRVLESLESLDPKIVDGDATPFEALVGQRLDCILRRGKYLMLEFAAPDQPEASRIWVTVHLRMTGRFVQLPQGASREAHAKIVTRWSGLDEEVHYRDVRRFGRWYCTPAGQMAPTPGAQSLGLEPMEMTEAQFLALMYRRKQRAKAALLRQDLVAGVGNIYADEALFTAGIHPEQDLSRLSKKRLLRLRLAIQQHLGVAIEKGGSTIADFSDAMGMAGAYQHMHRVYGKHGTLCPQCLQTGRETVLKRIVTAGRGTTFCPVCQKKRW